MKSLVSERLIIEFTYVLLIQQIFYAFGRKGTDIPTYKYTLNKSRVILYTGYFIC